MTTLWQHHATARYELAGPRIAGVIRVRIEPGDSDLHDFSSVWLGYGDPTDQWSTWRSGYLHTNQPSFNGARLGYDGVIQKIDTLLHDPDLNPDRLNARYRYPERAGLRLVATIRTVMRHWITRPDMTAVRQVAAVAHSIPRHRDMIADLDRIRARIDELTAEYDRIDRALIPITALYEQRATILTDLGLLNTSP